MKIDNFDKAILRSLQENSRLKSDSIAEQVGLSATACQRRIKRLRDMGAIEKEVAVINPKVSSHSLTLVHQPSMSVLSLLRLDFLNLSGLKN